MAEGWQQPTEGAGQELYLCPICSTRVSSTAKECPSCHAVFVEDGEGGVAAPAADAAPKVEPVQYKCPSCDATVGESDPKCPSCGAVFIDAAPLPASAPPPAPAPAPFPSPAARPAVERPPTVAKDRPAGAPGAKAPASPGGPSARTGAAKAAHGPAMPKPPTKRRQRPTGAAARQRRHSKAVDMLSARRKRIGQRTIIGLSAMAAGLGMYMVSLFIGGGGKFTLLTGLGMGLGIALFAIGVLIYSTQLLAKQHYTSQLENARAEAALLKELLKGRPSAASAAATGAVARPATPSRGRPAAGTKPWEEVGAPATAAGPAAATPVAAPAAQMTYSPSPVAAPGPASTSSITVEVAPSGPDDKDKLPCANCGYMNRRIFVRCIRCGTELQKQEQSIAVETFEKPEGRSELSKEVIRGGASVVPWEARRAAASQTSKAAARAAERRTALAEAEAAAAAKGPDRRAVIGVAANFQKLPREMRESLIRTLHRVDDPVVRQDVVSAIAENYTEVPRDIQELLGDLSDDEDARVREEVAFEVNRNFDRIPLDVVQGVFTKLARDPERMVREDVVSAIAENFQRLPKESQDLLKLLAQDRVESVRDEVSFEVAKNSDVIPEKFKSEVMELIKRVGGG